jgi:diguanylate cyclase (GGDEF)-like protein
MRANGGTVEYRARTADGRTIWVREAIRVTSDAQNGRTGLHGAMVDITELRAAEDASIRLRTLLEANARAAEQAAREEEVSRAANAERERRIRFQVTVAESIDDLVDARSAARRLSRALAELLRLDLVVICARGFEGTAIAGSAPEDIARVEHPGRCELLARLDELPPSAPLTIVQARCAHVPMTLAAVAALPLLDGRGEPIGAIAVGTNEAAWFAQSGRAELTWFAAQIGKALALALASERLSSSIARDPLTTLLRRDDFYARFEQELARASRHRTALALLRWDLIDFAEFNEQYGRRAGDRALRVFADVVRAELRGYDVAGRIGPDELGAVLFVEKHASAHIVAARIQKRAATARVGDVFIPFPARGFALFPDDGTDVTSLDRVSLVRLVNHRDTRLAFVRKEELPLVRAVADSAAG